MTTQRVGTNRIANSSVTILKLNTDVTNRINSSFNHANSAFIHANAAFNSSNNYVTPNNSVTGNMLTSNIAIVTTSNAKFNNFHTFIGLATVDFGSNAVYETISYVNDNRANVGSKIIVVSSAFTSNNEFGSQELGGDELIFDSFLVSANVISTGNIAFYIKASPGPVKGQRNFNYIIG